MTDRPFYYRWAYDPSSDAVELTHNDERRRSEAEYHLELKQRLGSDARGGNAYRIEGGWRIVGEDNQPEGDPRAVQLVVEAIRDREGTPLPNVL